MYQVIIIIHVLLGLGVIGLVLMQQGKGADAGAAFGSGSAGSVFGAQGAASFLSRSTAILATLFFSTSLGLAVVNGHKGTDHDLMATPAAEQNTSGLPLVQGAKTDTPPAPADVPIIPVTPPTPSAVPPTQPSVGLPATKPSPAATSEKVDSPKAETNKPAKEEKLTEQAKPHEEPKPVTEKKSSVNDKDKKTETEHKDNKSTKKEH